MLWAISIFFFLIITSKIEIECFWKRSTKAKINNSLKLLANKNQMNGEQMCVYSLRFVVDIFEIHDAGLPFSIFFYFISFFFLTNHILIDFRLQYIIKRRIKVWIRILFLDICQPYIFFTYAIINFNNNNNKNKRRWIGSIHVWPLAKTLAIGSLV